jgi:predicted GNAT family acetyltransferase
MNTEIAVNEQHPLDHPIWHALSTVHAHFAEGDELAKRYPADVSPLAAVREQSPQAYASLGKLLTRDEVTVFFLDASPRVPKGWRLLHDFEMHQMICHAPPPAADHESLIEPLSAPDIPQMRQLAEATEPGPFRSRTIEFGGYLGIRDAGRLVAMTGQRLSLPGFTEVSAVCTYPEYRGRGYAKSLVSAVARGIFARGETPILGVRLDNASAIRVYEKVGFTVRRNLHVVVVKKPL